MAALGLVLAGLEQRFELVGVVGEASLDRLFGLVGANELLEDVGELVGHAGGLVDADGGRR